MDKDQLLSRIREIVDTLNREAVEEFTQMLGGYGTPTSYKHEGRGEGLSVAAGALMELLDEAGDQSAGGQ